MFNITPFISSGLYTFFGSHEKTQDGYILDVNSNTLFSRFPILITDANFICGRRLAFGANNLDLAAQIIMGLLLAKENATESVESPRFHISESGNIGIEGNFYTCAILLYAAHFTLFFVYYKNLLLFICFLSTVFFTRNGPRVL